MNIAHKDSSFTFNPQDISSSVMGFYTKYYALQQVRDSEFYDGCMDEPGVFNFTEFLAFCNQIANGRSPINRVNYSTEQG